MEINMLVVSIENLTKTKVKVCLDNRTDFQLYKREVQKYNIVENEDLENYEEILREVLIPRAKKRAMHLLEKMDRTNKQLEDKLRRNGYPKEAIDEAIAYVTSYHYIDDERYALSYVRYHQESRSRNRIKQDLMQKGIDKEIIRDALESEYTVDEKELIKTYLKKKKYNPDTAERKDKEKMIRFLISKGFTYDDVLTSL